MNLADEYRATRAALRRLTPDEIDKPKVNSMISSMSYSIEWIETGIRPGTIRGIERRAGYEREICVGDKINHLAQCDPISIMADIKDQLRIEVALSCLTEREREAYKLVIGEGFSYQDAAEKMNVKKGALQSYIVRAHEKLNRNTLQTLTR